MPVKRGLQILLPPELPPTVVRLISQFADAYDDSALLGRYVRLSLHHGGSADAVLHDCYVVFEGPFGIVVNVASGASLQIPRADIGGMRWAVEPDTNPHSVSQLNAAWVSSATSNRRYEPIGSIDVHVGDAAARSCHRRVRGLGLNETVQRPTRPPFFVYMKMLFPYMTLQRGEEPTAAAAEGYKREASAYSVLHLCQPAVAPLLHYASFHEETGSYCCVVDDLVTLLNFDATPALGARDAKTMMHLFGALAVLHGRFLTEEEVEENGGSGATNEDAADSELAKLQALLGAPQPAAAKKKKRTTKVSFNKDLLRSMVHPKIFYATWREAVQDDEMLPILDDLYGVERSGNDGAEPLFASPRSLTMIHGNLQPAHIKLTKDRRASPNVYLLDWKRSGIGPLEVDLIQAYLLVPLAVRNESPDLLLHLLNEYSVCLRVFYNKSRSIVDLLQCMRDVCCLLARTAPFDWNHDGALTQDAMLQLHSELCGRTTAAQLTILQDRLPSMFS